MTIDPNCCEETKVSKIKVEEFGRKAIFENKNKTKKKKIKVDGCVIKNSPSADYIISCETLGDVIVELKGKDVEHAVDQVEATAEFWHKNQYRVGEMAALIVSTQFPKTNSKVRKAQENFARIYKSPLHVVTKNYEGCLEYIFSFKGPHRM